MPSGITRQPELPHRKTRLDIRACPPSMPQPRKFSVIIPRGDNSGKKIKRIELEAVAESVSNHFGGVTVDSPSSGCVYDEKKNKLQCERNIRMTAVRNYTKPDGFTLMERDEACERYMSDVEEINRIAERAGRTFGQYSIMTDVVPAEAATIPGDWQEGIDKGLLDWSLWRFNKAPARLEFD